MVELKLAKSRLGLAGYSPDTTLAGLLDATESFVSSLKKQSVQCRMCGECCSHAPLLGLDLLTYAEKAGMDVREWAQSNLLLPEIPFIGDRRKGIAELAAQGGIAARDAAVLYEFNRSEPISFLHTESNRCVHQQDNLCSVYPDRPFICRLYLCRFGDRLQDLHEMIVTQGTWHAYALLGAVPMEEIAHNPFAGKESYEEVMLKDFEFDLGGTAGELFSFF